jgi:hypothetical protein
MTAPEDRVDPQWLQARWVLGGLTAEEIVNQAGLALEQGFDGPALRQLAGFLKPTLRDLEGLPERAFTDMGLTISPWRVSSGTRPISRRYRRTGSLVFSSTSGVRVNSPSSPASSSDSDRVLRCEGSSPSRDTSMPCRSSIVAKSSISSPEKTPSVLRSATSLSLR